MLLRGGYPALRFGSVDGSDSLANYVATYVERDVQEVLEARELISMKPSEPPPKVPAHLGIQRAKRFVKE